MDKLGFNKSGGASRNLGDITSQTLDDKQISGNSLYTLDVRNDGGDQGGTS